MRPENERIPQGVAMIHSYPWYFDDWLLSRTRMSMNSSERGIYRDVLDICYRDGKVPDDPNLLQRMLAVSAKELRTAWPAIRKQLVEVEGGLSHPRVIAELPDLERLAALRSKASSNAARTRWAKQKHARGNAPRMPDASATQCASDADSCRAIAIAIATTSGSTGASEIDHENEFLSRWSLWPAKGRTRQPLCQQQWCEAFATLNETESRVLLAEIDDGLSMWLNSTQFEKGFVFGFADFIAQRRWKEDPEQRASCAPEPFDNEEIELHWQEVQRLKREGLPTAQADEQARHMISERRRQRAKPQAAIR